MPPATKSKTEEIVVPERAVVHEHPESRFKYTSFTLPFPDGYDGLITVYKGVKSRWTPSGDIEKIVVYFK